MNMLAQNQKPCGKVRIDYVNMSEAEGKHLSVLKCSLKVNPTPKLTFPK